MKVTCIHNGSIEVKLEPEDLIEKAFLLEIAAGSGKGQKLVVSTEPGSEGIGLRMDKT